jgi:hypothetical protein
MLTAKTTQLPTEHGLHIKKTMHFTAQDDSLSFVAVVVELTKVFWK